MFKNFNRQGVNAVIHQPVERGVDQPVSFDRQLTLERGAGDPHVKVTLAFARMSGVLVALVQHLKSTRCERLLQALTDLLDDRLLAQRNARFTAALCETA